jgi:hypothetical protein
MRRFSTAVGPGEQIQDLTPDRVYFRRPGLEWYGVCRKGSVPVLPRAAVVLTALSLLAPAFAAAGDEDDAKKGKKPGLLLRASPRYAFSPVNVFFTAELKGGDDVEEMYCPEVEWEWDDGGKSVQEADCEPFGEGSKIERRFTANHTFQRAGLYRVRVTLRKTGRNITSQTVQVTVRAGLGDSSPDPGM